MITIKIPYMLLSPVVLQLPVEILDAAFLHKSEHFCENLSKTNKNILW